MFSDILVVGREHPTKINNRSSDIDGHERTVLRHMKTHAHSVFLPGAAGLVFLLFGSVFLGFAALLRDLRPRRWLSNASSRRLR